VLFRALKVVESKFSIKICDRKVGLSA